MSNSAETRSQAEIDALRQRIRELEAQGQYTAATPPSVDVDALAVEAKEKALSTPEPETVTLPFSIPETGDRGFVGFITQVARIETAIEDVVGDDLPLSIMPMLVDFTASVVALPTRSQRNQAVADLSLPQLFDLYRQIKSYNGDEKKG